MKRTWDLALAALFGTLALAALYEVTGEWLGARSKPRGASAPAMVMDSPQIILPPKEGFRGGPTVQDPTVPITPEQQKYLDDLLHQGTPLSER